MKMDDTDKLVALEMVGGLAGTVASNLISTAAAREVSRAAITAKAKQAALSSVLAKAATLEMRGLGQAAMTPAAWAVMVKAANPLVFTALTSIAVGFLFYKIGKEFLLEK